MNPLYELLELIATGEQEQADELFDSLVGERVSDILDQTRADLAAQIFASTEGEVIEEGEVKKANKAKKNAYHDSVSTKSLFKSGGTLHNRGLVRRNDAAKRDSDLKMNRKKAVYKHIIKKVMTKESVEQLDELSKKTLGSYVSKAASDAFGAGHDAGSAKLGSAKSMKGYEKGTKRLAGIRKATKKLSEAMSDEMKAKVKADMEKRRAAKNAALDSAKKEMEGWKPDKKDLRKLYKKED